MPNWVLSPERCGVVCAVVFVVHVVTFLAHRAGAFGERHGEILRLRSSMLLPRALAFSVWSVVYILDAFAAVEFLLSTPEGLPNGVASVQLAKCAHPWIGAHILQALWLASSKMHTCLSVVLVALVAAANAACMVRAEHLMVIPHACALHAGWCASLAVCTWSVWAGNSDWPLAWQMVGAVTSLHLLVALAAAAAFQGSPIVFYCGMAWGLAWMEAKHDKASEDVTSAIRLHAVLTALIVLAIGIFDECVEVAVLLQTCPAEP